MSKHKTEQKGGNQKDDQGPQRQRVMGDEQDEELKRPVKAGQRDQRGQDDRRRQSSQSEAKEEAGRSQQSEPRR
jgi:hypothetical protein